MTSYFVDYEKNSLNVITHTPREFFSCLRVSHYAKYEKNNLFNVLRFGYEYTTPEVVKTYNKIKTQTLDLLRKAPDFVVINNKTHEVCLVEVKYKNKINGVVSVAKEIQEYWGTAKLFVATPDSFYFGDVKDIIKNKKIDKLDNIYFKKNTQNKYLELLVKYEINN